MAMGYQNQWIPITQAAQGLCDKFDFYDASTKFSVSAIADGSAGKIQVTTSAAHGYSVDDIVFQFGFSDSNYNGVFRITDIVDTTNYKVTATYTATGTGYSQQGDRLKCNASGYYRGTWSSTGKAVSSSETFAFAPFINTTQSKKALAKRKFAWDDFGSFSGCGIMHINKGDIVQFAVENTSNTNNIIIETLTLVLQLIERD